ncbi:MAG: DUF4136 domain-containing protein [Acidobacteriota bacterium]|nr:DUF4136 domain-containing protein [Acidobacteriota bacterium]
MKRTPVLVATLFLAGFLAGCSSIETKVDYDRNASFSSYKTFAFKDVRSPDSPISMRRVQGAIDRTLTSRGFARAEGTPDLWVVLHTRTRRQTQVTTYNSGWGWGWGWRGGYWNSARVEQIPIGTLMVDLIDTKAKELVWRGSASRILESDETPKDRDENVQEAVNKLFDGFPPKS